MNQKATINFGAKGWGIILYCALMYWLNGAFQGSGQNILVTTISQKNDWDYATCLSFSTFGGWICVISTILFGQLIIRKGARIVGTIGLLIGAVVVYLYGHAASIGAYAIAVVLVAVAGSAYTNTVPNTLMNSWFPKTKGIALGWATMGYCLDVFFIPLALAIFTAFGIDNSFTIFAIFFILLAGVTYAVIRNRPEEAGAAPDNDPNYSKEELARQTEIMKSYKSDWTIKRLLKTKEVWLIGISLGLLWMTTVGIMSQLVPRLVSIGYERSFAVNLLTVVGVCGIFGSYFWGWLDQKTGTKKACQIYTVYYILCLFMLIISRSTIMVMITVILAGAGIGGIGNLMPSMVGTVWGRFDFAAANRVVSPIFKLLQSSTYLVSAAALTMTGGYTGAYMVYIGVCVISFILLWFLDDKMIGKQ